MMAKTAGSKQQPEVTAISSGELEGIREITLNTDTKISWVNKQTKATL
jgi:hypothetical protein